MDLESLKRIIAKGNFSAEEVLPFLKHPSLETRINANFLLAEYYFNQKKYKEAEVFVERLWLLSRYDLKYIDIYLLILQQVKNSEKAREILKYAARKAFEDNNIDRLIDIANKWQSAYILVEGKDISKYDLEIFEIVEKSAKSMKDKLAPLAENKTGKIKVGYFLFGLQHSNSIIVRLTKIYAELHDREKFDVYYIIPFPPSFFAGRPEAHETIDFLKKHNVEIIFFPEEKSVAALVQVANRMREIGLDIFHITAGASDLRFYFLLCLRPARVVAGYITGMMPLYAAPAMDIGICSPEARTIMESPLDIEVVGFPPELPSREHKYGLFRSDLGIGADNIILLTVGRGFKYQSSSFWQVIDRSLSSHPECFFIGVGLEKIGRDLVDKYISAPNKTRVIITDMINNPLDYTNLADIYIDSFPRGGAMGIYEAMALGKPVISVKEDLMNRFEVDDWMPASNMVYVPECFFAPDDLDGMFRQISEWVKSPEKRREIAKKCEKKVRSVIISPEKHIGQIESLYKRLIQ